MLWMLNAGNEAVKTFVLRFVTLTLCFSNGCLNSLVHVQLFDT